MTIINHYGIEINSELAITGVFDAHDFPELIDEAFNNGIDLDFEAYCKEPANEDPTGERYEQIEPTMLIGYTIAPGETLYDVDPKANLSAIINTDSNTIQVTKSYYLSLCEPCSPCCPGQASGDVKGQFLTFVLPEEYYNESAKEPLLMIHNDSSDADILDLWELHRDTPYYEDEEGIMRLETDFHIWTADTDRDTIWHWFDFKYSKGIHTLLYRKEE